MKNKILILLFLACTAVSNAQLSMITDASGNASMENGSFTTDVNTFKGNIGSIKISNVKIISNTNVIGFWAGKGIELLPGTEIKTMGEGIVKFENLILPNSTRSTTGKMAEGKTEPLKTTHKVDPAAIERFKARQIATAPQKALASTLSVYPNPTTNIINISTEENNEVLEIIVSDLSGRTLYIEKSKNIIDLKEKPAGTYILHIKTKNKTFTEKIIKK